MRNCNGGMSDGSASGMRWARSYDRGNGLRTQGGMPMAKNAAKITRTNPKTISKPFSNYAHVVTVEGAKKLVFCAGQVAADVKGNVLPPTSFEAQARMVMK